MDQGERIQELLKQLSSGDGATIVELLFCLADHVLTIPAHRRAANKAENAPQPTDSSASPPGTDPALKGQGRPRREPAGPEKVRLFTTEENGRKLVPVFTSADRFLDWSDGSHQLLSLAGADLALVLGKEVWLHVDPGSEHQVTLPPKSLSLLSDPEKLRPLLPERYQQAAAATPSEEPLAVTERQSRTPAGTTAVREPRSAEQPDRVGATSEKDREAKVAAGSSAAIPATQRPPAERPAAAPKKQPASTDLSKDELERALRGEPRGIPGFRQPMNPASKRVEAPTTPAPKPFAPATSDEEIFDSSTRVMPAIPVGFGTATGASSTSTTDSPLIEDDEIFDSSTRAVPAVPQSLAASWKISDQPESGAKDLHDAPTAVAKPAVPPLSTTSHSAAASAGGPRTEGRNDYTAAVDSSVENGARASEPAAASVAESRQAAVAIGQQVVDEELILEQLSLSLREFSDVEEAYFLSAPDRVKNGTIHSGGSQHSSSSRSWVIGIIAPRQGVENRFHLISRLAELSREFFGEAGALEVYDDLHVESSASWRFFRSEIPFYVRERSRFESARDRTQSKHGENADSSTLGSRYHGSISQSSETDEAEEPHWQRTARSLLLDSSAYDSERSEKQKKRDPKQKRFWGFKGS